MLIHESIHILLSLAVALIAHRICKNRWVLIVPFLTGFLLDVDHLIDYLIYRRSWQFNLNEFSTGGYFEASGKLYVFLHSYELALLLLATSVVIWLDSDKKSRLWPAILASAGISLIFHLVYDTIYYQPDWNTYFLISRVYEHFTLGSFHFH